MSRGYLNNFPNFEKLLRDGMKADGVEDQFSSAFSRKDSEIFKVAARLVRFFSHDVKKLREIFEQAGPYPNNITFKQAFEGFPLTILGKEPDTFRVFPNITIGDLEFEEMSNCCWAMSWHVLDETFERSREKEYKRPLSWFEEITRDLKDTHKAKGWATTRRIITRLKRSDEVSIAKILTHNLAAKGLSASQIQNMATAITEARKPMEIKEVKSLEDTIEMYASGPSSCMSWGSRGNSESRGWSFLPNKCGVHPSAFFFYHPYVKGVYAMAKERVVARTFLYQIEVKGKEKWFYGRVYSTNGKVHQTFINTLKQQYDAQDISKSPDGIFCRTAEFKIPGVKYEPGFGANVYVCPVPYFDNMLQCFTFSFDNTTKEFTVSMEKGIQPNLTAGSGGYILSSNLTRAICHFCSASRRPTEMVAALDGEHFFCNSHCMQSGGYCRALRSDGMRVVVPLLETVRDIFSKERYSNEEALRAQGGLPSIAKLSLDNSDDIPEDDEEELTLVGVPVKINDRMFRLYTGTELSNLEIRFKNKELDKKHAKLIRHPVFGSCYEIIYPESEKQDRIPMKIQRVRTVMYDPQESWIKEAA
jgi:hypothetical protein